MGGLSMEWKEVTLGDFMQCNPKRTIKKGQKARKITMDLLIPHSKTIRNWNYEPYSGGAKFQNGDTIMARITPCLENGKHAFVSILDEGEIAYGSTEYFVFCGKEKVSDNDFVYYLTKTPLFRDTAIKSMVGSSGRQRAQMDVLENLKMFVPKDISDQRRIASILSSLDRKIELNNKINADLEEMAQAIFKNWFVDFEPFKDGKFVDSELGMIPEGWKVGRLTEIASYMNGLAMQKFPPENNEDSLPVLKIKELGQGFCGTDSDRCSCNIKDECKIHNGDVIFSWSGTLLVDVWCGGDCGLNQHLFKVTSKDYPKWFYYYWTKHHLQEFIHIAKDKAVTMGHIKRGHLEEAMVAIPDNDSMEKAHELFEPILSKMISLRLESSRLSLLRDTLLPRLMSGELEVPE